MAELINVSRFDTKRDFNYIQLFTLKTNKGITTQITNYGGRIVNLFTPDKNGYFSHIVFGYDNIDDYLNKEGVFFGATIGRYGNRIANRKFM
jgi:aldose 1-epimerase